MEIPVRVKRLPHCPGLPSYATLGSAGMDLRAAIDAPINMRAGQRWAIPTGLMIQIPVGYEGQIRARSGLATKSGIGLANGIGTIDCDFRDEIIVLLINFGNVEYTIMPAARIAQLIVAPCLRARWVEVEDFGTPIFEI
ncbi:MAG: dUTP diphosphatase [Leptolyngbya sp.]|nr:dUTP diphosphatase [Candidatus Melainabacteria bacterium]